MMMALHRFNLRNVLFFGLMGMSLCAVFPDTVHRRESCGTDPAWAPTIDAWEAADTDRRLRGWWHMVVSENPGASLTNELARQFGSGYSDYACSITDQGSCIIPGCQDYVDSDDPIWAYLALNAIVNVNTFMNRLWQGIGLGQDDFGNKASAIAQTFFPWHDPTIEVSEALFWVDATVGALFGFIVPESRLGIAGREAIVAFTSAGIQEAQLSLKYDPDLTLEQGTAEISLAAAESAKQSRKNLEQWANKLFSGRPDDTGKTIIDYLIGGSFITLPKGISNYIIERFWESSLTARTINSEWITQPYFVTSAKVDDPSVDIGPSRTKYYSKEAKRVYYLYAWRNGGLEMPEAMLELPAYGIRPSAVTEASARAFEVNKFNYTNQVALSQLHESLFNVSSNPILDGAGWTGNFNISVCDMDYHVDWNGRYGESTMAPCCCGNGCKDTKTFVAFANLHGSQSYLKQCRRQLKGTGMEFDDIDYGFHIVKYPPKIIAAIVVPTLLAFFAIVGLFLCLVV